MLNQFGNVEIWRDTMAWPWVVTFGVFGLVVWSARLDSGMTPPRRLEDNLAIAGQTLEGWYPINQVLDSDVSDTILQLQMDSRYNEYQMR